MIRKIVIIFSVFLLIISCQNNENAATIEDNTRDSIKVKEVKDTTIRFQIIDQFAIFTKGSDTICKTYLKSSKHQDNPSQGDSYTLDEAIMVASCMIVIRDVHYLGDFCHIPSVKKVEIYTQYGDTLYPAPSYIQGNYYTAQGGDWGIINDEAEGDIYGYIHITSKGELNYYTLDDVDFYYLGEGFDVTISDSIIRYNQFSSDFRGVKSQLEVYKDGSHKFIYPTGENDIIDFVFFNEYEPWAYISQPYFYFSISSDGNYTRECFKVDKYKMIENGVTHFSFWDLVKDGLFMHSGINVSSAPMNVQLINKQLKNNTKILLEGNDYLLMEGITEPQGNNPYYETISLKYNHNGYIFELLNDEAQKISYEGEKVQEVIVKYAGDINGDSFLDFLLILETDLCNCNRAVLSDTTGGLNYNLIYKDDACWD